MLQTEREFPATSFPGRFPEGGFPVIKGFLRKGSQEGFPEGGFLGRISRERSNQIVSKDSIPDWTARFAPSESACLSATRESGVCGTRQSASPTEREASLVSRERVPREGLQRESSQGGFPERELSWRVPII